MPNIKDVAERAHVSSTTVSHVLNNTRYVDPRTKSRVLAAMEELGYRPNAVARSLRRQETLTIGIVVHDLGNPFFTSFVKCVESVAQQAGYNVILCSSGENPERMKSVLEVLSAKRVDGLMVSPVSQEDPTLISIERHGTPVVYLGRRPLGASGPEVHDNSLGAAISAIQHLADDGHVRIGVITGCLAVPSLAERMAAYRQVLEQRGLAFDERMVKVNNFSVDDAKRSMRALLELDRPPTAVFTTNMLMTTGALAALHEARVRCPQEMALVGYDDSDWASIFNPPLTVLRQPTERGAIAAAELLLGYMRGEKAMEQEIVLPAELVVRGSCSESCLRRMTGEMEEVVTRE